MSDGPETWKERLAAALADIWADFSDVIEDNPRGAAIMFILGLVTMAAARFVFR